MKFSLLGLLLICQSVLADTEIQTISLKHRIAKDVLPHIQAIVPDTAVVRAFDNKLIIKAERATIQNVIELLKSIDVAQQSLLLNVLRTHRQLKNSSSSSASVAIEVADETRAHAQINRWSTTDSGYKDQNFKLRAVSGYPVTINVGQDHPQKNQFVFVHPAGGLTVQNETYYVSADNGFKAQTFLLPDDLVRIEIYPFFASINSNTGQINRSELITTLTGTLGQWLEVAVISNNETIQRDGTTTYSSSVGQHQYIYLKVEPQTN